MAGEKGWQAGRKMTPFPVESWLVHINIPGSECSALQDTNKVLQKQLEETRSEFFGLQQKNESFLKQFEETRSFLQDKNESLLKQFEETRSERCALEKKNAKLDLTPS